MHTSLFFISVIPFFLDVVLLRYHRTIARVTSPKSALCFSGSCEVFLSDRSLSASWDDQPHAMPQLPSHWAHEAVADQLTAAGRCLRHEILAGGATGFLGGCSISSSFLGKNNSCICMSPVVWILQVVQPDGSSHPRHFCKLRPRSLTTSK